VLQLPQSTISRHLKALGDAGWITSRAEGTSNLYTMARELDAPARKLWQVVREQVGTTPAAGQDHQRLQRVLADRRSKTQEFFATTAGQWDRLRDDLFGDRFHLLALTALVDRRWIVGDLGCGTGQLAAALAPHVAEVIGVDASAAMLQAARKRLQHFDNVNLRRGELESLPIDDARLDLATAMLVLHHVVDPEKATVEMARVVKPRGRLLLVDMLPHERENYRQQMGHVWLGFSNDQIRRLLEAAGFADVTVTTLPPDPKAKGPTLFAATAWKRDLSK
jgi:ArsR family transcriptional regulator